MQIRTMIPVLDAADLATESSFWAAVLGGTVDREDDWHSIMVDGEFRLGVQLAHDHVPPEWPSGQRSQQLHLDVYVDDIEAADRDVRDLGARPLTDPDLSADEGFRVYADPAGHPFCLCW